MRQIGWIIVLLKAPFGTIALGASLRRLPIVDVTTQVLLATRVRGGTTINMWRSRTQSVARLFNGPRLQHR